MRVSEWVRARAVNENGKIGRMRRQVPTMLLSVPIKNKIFQRDYVRDRELSFPSFFFFCCCVCADSLSKIAILIVNKWQFCSLLWNCVKWQNNSLYRFMQTVGSHTHTHRKLPTVDGLLSYALVHRFEQQWQWILSPYDTAIHWDLHCDYLTHFRLRCDIIL